MAFKLRNLTMELRMEQQIMQALQGGASPEEVVQALVQDGMSQDEAVSMVQSVMQSAQGGEGGAPAAQGLSSDDAIRVFSEMNVAPDVIIQVLKVLLNMNGAEIEKLLMRLEEGSTPQAPENPETSY